MSESHCFWHIFDENSRRKFEEGNVLLASISATLSFWLLATILLSNLRSDLSYRNFAYFTLASFIRCAGYVLSYMTFFKCVEQSSFDDGDVSCNFFGFWASFISVYEVECLTHICIERYVIAKYITNGWELQKGHYVLYQVLCVMFAAAYSLPPVFGLGRYGLDFSCSNCVLDMVLPETWDRYVIIVIYLLRSVKSTGFIITMLVWARTREARYNKSKNLERLSSFTQNTVFVTVVNLLCWMPIVVIRGWTIISFLLYNHMEETPPATWIQWAMWIQWIAPAVTAISMFLIDETLRNKMCSTFKDNDENDVKNK